jgi:hypothetical protein
MMDSSSSYSELYYGPGDGTRNIPSLPITRLSQSRTSVNRSKRALQLPIPLKTLPTWRWGLGQFTLAPKIYASS